MALTVSERESLQSRGDRDRLKASNLISGSEEYADDPNDQYTDAPTLRQGEFVPCLSKRVPKDTVLAVGFGTDERNSGRSAFGYVNVVASGDGTGAAGDLCTGILWYRIRDTRNRRTKEDTPTGDVADLADAEEDSRTERPMQPVMEPAGRPDQFVQMGIVADANSDGYVVDPSASSVRQYLTDIQIR